MAGKFDRIIPLGYGLFAAAAGIVAACYGSHLIHDNEAAQNVIVTVFSILAGFLIAIMTLLGDQSVLPGSWRIAEQSKISIKSKLTRQKWLFYCYLVTLSLIFINTLIEAKYPCASLYLERLYFGFATTSFILSFKLPSTLMSVQTDRIEAVISARRASASKLDKN
ncbi:MAG: hypothetical protein CML29_13450 [Rhizobiales bacterium]|nr:hypothetical protein [Hyphomicrobiales bacterium]MBA69853.1 hypothetical protein [Hyphomicrobiales bacterium]|tara:strand:+ start:920 stop:1417 length:498 start_codon:yes stop_codon:yes gene_type:complete